jgi:hypothetical protein
MQDDPGMRKYTLFGFESGGRRFFSVSVPGWTRIEPGMTVIALLKKSGDWGWGSLLGWIDYSDGSVVCDSPSPFLGIFAVFVFFLPFFALGEIQNPWVAELSAALLGSGAIWSLYRFAEALLVKRALMAVRDQNFHRPANP